MKKKTTALLIALCVVAMIFASCGNDGTVSSNSSSSSGTPSESSSTVGDSSSSKGEPTNLRVEVFDRANENGSDPTDNYWTDWIKQHALEDLNINVTFESVPRSEEIPKLNVLMAGGSPPDIVFTYSNSVAYSYYKQGGLADLTDPMAEYGKTITKYLGNDILEYGKFDGRQYLVPAKRIALAAFNTFIRKDWLDKLNMKMPTNMDEFYNVLKAFKEKNPGNVDRVIPYGYYSTGNITESFIEYAKMTDEERFVNGFSADNRPLFYKGFKEGIRYLNKLYNDGLLDSEFALNESSSNDEKVMRGQVGVWGSNFDSPIRMSPGVYTQLKENIPGAEIEVLDCFINVADGTHMRTMYSPYGLFAFVPASSKNVEGAIKYMDWMCRDDVRVYISIGEEGVNHTIDEEGIPSSINLQNDRRMMNSAYNNDYNFLVNGIDFGEGQEKNLKAMAKSYDPIYKDWFINAYNTALHDAIVYIPYAVPPFEAEGKYQATLNEKCKEIMTKAISAPAADFDKVYDAGMAEFLAMGGQEIIDARQAYWDSVHK